jgi:hypothetical protein
MATIQIKNNKTGFVATATQADWDAGVYKGTGMDWSLVSGAPATPAPASPAQPLSASQDSTTWKTAQSQSSTPPAPAGVDGRLLGPTEFGKLNKQWAAAGLTPDEVRQNFVTLQNGSYYLKNGAPTTESIIANRATPKSTDELASAGNFNVSSDSPNLPNPNNEQGMASSITGTQATIDELKRQRDEILQKQLDESRKQIEEIKKQRDAAFAEAKDLATPFQEQLEKAERERLKVEENFFANQEAIGELQTLMNYAVRDTEGESARTGLYVMSQGRMSNIKADYEARVGVVQATMAARNNQISVALDLIDRTTNSIVADKQRMLDYYSTMVDFYNTQEIKLEGKEQDALDGQMKVLEEDIASAQAISDEIKKIMLEDPNRAFKSGIKLTDSLDVITAKLAAFDYKQERIDLINTYESKGYNYLKTPADRDKYPASRILNITDSRGITNSFLIPLKTTGAGSKFEFAKNDKSLLMGVNFTTEDIADIEKLFNGGYSVESIINTNSEMTTDQQNALRAILTGRDFNKDADRKAQIKSYVDAYKSGDQSLFKTVEVPMYEKDKDGNDVKDKDGNRVVVKKDDGTAQTTKVEVLDLGGIPEDLRAETYAGILADNPNVMPDMSDPATAAFTFDLINSSFPTKAESTSPVE